MQIIPNETQRNIKAAVNNAELGKATKYPRVMNIALKTKAIAKIAVNVK